MPSSTMSRFGAAAAAALLAAAVNGEVQEPTMGEAVQAKKNPLRKVITLLEEMKKQTEKEAEEDLSSYEKYECWCTTSEKEKTAAVAEADSRINDLTAFLEEAAGKEGQLKTEIEALAGDIKDDQDALASATGIREKENTAFSAEEADTKETLAALKQAIQVLSKVQLVQKGKGVASVAEEARQAAKSLLQVSTIVQARYPQFKAVMQKDLFDVLGALQDDKPKPNTAFLSGANPNYWEPTVEEAGAAAKPNGLEGAAAGAKSYNSRSGSIFGILTSMSDQFVRDLSNAQKEEFMALVEFQKLRAAKLSEIAAAQEQKKAKETELADLLAKVATSKEDLAAMQEAKAKDQEFLANLEETCTEEANNYESRKKVRSEEIKAIGETLSILNADDARETFGKTLTLLQVASGTNTEDSANSAVAAQDRLVEKAMKRIAAVAKKHKNWALVSLAVRVRLDAFSKVKEMIDKMFVDLQKEQKEEYDKNEYCKAEIDKTEDEIKVATQEKKDLDEQHMGLVNTLKVAAADIEQLQSDVHENEVSMKQAGEARKEENQLFQTSIADQRATISILNKALARLREFYGGPEFVQIRAHGRQEPGAAVAAPPSKPADYSKSDAAGGVLQMLMKVISDAEATEAQMETSEQHSQAGYATLVEDTKASIEADRAAIAMKLEEQAKAEGDKSSTEESQLSNQASLDTLSSTLMARHTDCDWLMKYFDVRQTARKEEMDSLTDAKAILSGANYGK